MSNNKIAKINFEIKNDKIILPAKYLNYKNCLVLGLIKKADSIKLDIIKNYPDSKYAEILNNPDSLASLELDNLTEIYSGLFKDFQNQKYTQLIVELDELIATYETDPLVPKMQLLKASAVARIQGFESYKTLLEFISANYSNSIEGKEAKILLDQVIPLIKNSKFDIVKSQLSQVLHTWMESQDDFLILNKMPLIKPTLHPLDRNSKWNKVSKENLNEFKGGTLMKKVFYKRSINTP